MYYDKRWNMPFFSKNMSVNIFFSLRNHLHLTDIASRPSDCKDRLFKVRPIIEQVRRQLHQLPLEENLCVDEQIIPFKGKFMAKQYVKGKPCPWGIKVFFLCGKSGMPFDFIVYQGSTTPLNQTLVKAVGSGSTIVLELAKRIPADAKGHKLYFDNYFPSFQLFELLHNRGICAAGTVRVNRFGNPPLPDAKSMAKRGRGSSAQCWSDNGQVIFTRWFDNKVVNMASNFVGIGVEDRAQRWDKKSQKDITVKRPEVVRLYNECMGGVDLLDQMIQYYRISIRTRKWTIRVIMHFVDLAITAAWIQYRNDCKANMIPKNKILDSLNFRAEVADCLLAVQQINTATEEEPPRRRGRPSLATPSTSRQSTPDSKELNIAVDTIVSQPKRKRTVQVQPPEEVRKDTIMHMPDFVQEKNAGRCKRPGCTKKSFIICKKCKVYLCLKRENNCFAKFHGE